MLFTDFYQPLPKQALFHKSMAMYRLHVGGYGSGKTLNLLMEAIITCHLVPGSNSLILRTTSPDIQKTVINKFLNPKLVPPSLYKSYNKNEKIAYFENGSQIHFGYCQRDEQVSQYLSTEYVFIGLEEAGEFSFRVWEALSGRSRTSTEVTDVNGNRVQTSLGLTTNPYGIGWSWIKKLFVEHKPVEGMGKYNPLDYFYVHSTVYDNPYVCTPEYIAKLEGMTGAMRKKALEGDMNDISGQFYPQFIPDPLKGKHVRDVKSISFRTWDPIWIGADWGMAHHFPILWVTKGWIPDEIKGGMRQVNVVYRELILQGMNANQVADEIHRQCVHGKDGTGPIGRQTEQVKNIFLSWERFVRTGAETNHSIAQVMGERLQKYRLPYPQRADKNRVDGWNLIGQLLDQDDLVITTDCPVLIGSLPLLVHDKVDVEDVKKSDTLEDDIADALRYALKSYLKPGTKPESVIQQEKLMSIKDPYVRSMLAYKDYNLRQAGKQPFTDKRKTGWQQRSGQ